MSTKIIGTALWCLLLICIAGIFLWLIRKNNQLKQQVSAGVYASEEAVKYKTFQEAMLPKQLLDLLQNGTSGKIRLGEPKVVPAAVLSFNIHGFLHWIRTKTAEEIFQYINEVLKHVVPSVLYQEGEIDRFVDAGLKAFFLKSPEGALRAAISICEAMDSKETRSQEFAMGLACGDVMVGMVGDAKRFGTLTISETTGFADFLQEMGNRYGARILLTGSLKEQIRDFERNYNSRYLGKILIRSSGVFEDIYDVYDGDDQVSRNLKRKTKLLFEKGVCLFQEQKFYDARLHFIEVLKANRMDGAAKQYLYLCNQCQEIQDAGKEKIQLEEY